MFFLKRRFLPLFCTQFLGAFNDNFLRFAIVSIMTFSLNYPEKTLNGLLFAAIGLLMLPFFLFSATAGAIADRFDRARAAQFFKVVELVLMIPAFFAVVCRQTWALLILLFAMGTQSAFFGPVKYALLPQHLKERELLMGNAVIQAGTYMAILTGSIAGSLLAVSHRGLTGLFLIVIAAAGWLASRFIPEAPGPDPGLKIGFNIFSDTVKVLKIAAGADPGRRILHCICVLSAFWMTAGLYTSQLSSVVRNALGGDESVSGVFLALFSIGVGAGALAAGKLMRGGPDLRPTPICLLVMMALTVDVGRLCATPAAEEGLRTAVELACDRKFVRIALDLFGIAFAGGFFAIPLQTVIQQEGRPSEMARLIAANNIINSLYMACGTLLAIAGCAWLNWGNPQVMYFIAVCEAANAVYAFLKLRPAASAT